MARMKLRKLEEYLQGVDGFEQPKILLEQYPTPPHIAACMAHHMQAQHEDIEGRLVGDLGCGCGMLSIASTLLGAQLTVGFELDGDAVDTFRGNVVEMELPNVDCVRADVLQLAGSKWEKSFDTVVMNPPFGTKHNAGMDMRFLEVALRLANSAVYSLHKTSTRSYIQKKAQEWGARGSVVAELRYNIDASYKFHKHKSKDIEVDFWRFDISKE
ncbi:rRNA N6-adenosine-methyltransferase METTL5 [Drosophila subpulchrella]|uniref:rRNA N6-adenosine-methyltransferase METTL5 n=1 Tax=Drosophila subpulchrella TaxID=1486046 RepID=UPI0018A1614C|nr:rRNA N6-adenosine-methyltransferase METTL5 [Drosophila subpulchrella]